MRSNTFLSVLTCVEACHDTGMLFGVTEDLVTRYEQWSVRHMMHHNNGHTMHYNECWMLDVPTITVRTALGMAAAVVLLLYRRFQMEDDNKCLRDVLIFEDRGQ